MDGDHGQQSGLADGTYLFRATVTDAAGNTSTTATQTVTIDTNRPTAGTLSLTGFTDTGSSSSDGLSNDSTFGLSVSGEEAGASVSFEVSTDKGVTGQRPPQPVRPGGRDLPVPGDRDRCGWECLHHRHPDGHHRHHRPHCGTLSLTGFTTPGLRPPMASRTTIASIVVERQRGWLDPRARGFSTDNGA